MPRNTASEVPAGAAAGRLLTRVDLVTAVVIAPATGTPDESVRTEEEVKVMLVTPEGGETVVPAATVPEALAVIEPVPDVCAGALLSSPQPAANNTNPVKPAAKILLTPVFHSLLMFVTLLD
jgi:hypothetical protein